MLGARIAIGEIKRERERDTDKIARGRKGKRGPARKRREETSKETERSHMGLERVSNAATTIR